MFLLHRSLSRMIGRGRHLLSILAVMGAVSANPAPLVLDDTGKPYVPLPILPMAQLNARLLAVHNAERARMNLPLLVWNDQLAADARGWAKHLAQQKVMRLEHDMRDPNREGENLWAGSIHDYTPEEMVGAWIAEKQDYRAGIFPNVSRTGDWEDVGHYTQIIWQDTRQVGCAVVANGNDEYLVCRYAKPGNWNGERAIHGR